MPSTRPLVMYVPEPPPETILTSMPAASMRRTVSIIRFIASRDWRFFSSSGQTVRRWPS